MQANPDIIPDLLRLALNDALTYDKVNPYAMLEGACCFHWLGLLPHICSTRSCSILIAVLLGLPGLRPLRRLDL